MFYTIALSAHVLSGGIALISGLLAIFFKKGQTQHKVSGKVYYYCMLVVSISAISMALMKYNMFLLCIGIFSGYMVYSGYRAIQEKSYRTHVLDWILVIASVVNSGFMILSLNPVLLVFGGIGFVLSVGDLRFFIMKIMNKDIPKIQWLVRHIGMMMGGYISTFTAFLVVNITEVQYPILVWLLPTIIGTPLITYWTRTVKPKKQTV